MSRKQSKYSKPTREMNIRNMKQLNYFKVLTPKNMKSSVWKYFGFPGDNNNQVITKTVIYCTLCFASFKNNRNTTNLRMHLTRSHQNLKNNSDIESSCADISSYNENQNSEPLIQNNIKHEYFTTHTTNPLNEVLADDFKVCSLDYKNQSCINVGHSKEQISDISKQSNVQIATESSSQKFFPEENLKVSYSISETNYYNDSSISVQDILRDMIIEDILPTDIIGRKGFENTLNILCKGYSMPQKEEVEDSIVKIYVEKSTKIFEKLKFHTFHKPFALSYDIWENILNQRYITFYFYYVSDDFEISLKDIQLKTTKFSQYTSIGEIFEGYHLKNCTAIVGLPNEFVEEFFMKYDVQLIPCFECTIKNCIGKTFNLLPVSSIYSEVKQYFEELLLSQDIGIPNLYRELPWTKYNVLSFFCEHICWPDDPNNELLPKAKSILDTISHLKMTVDSLAEESNTISSLSRPLSSHLMENNFSVVKGDSHIVYEIKKSIYDILGGSILKSNLLLASSLLDPRFCKFLSDESINNIKDSLYIKVNKDEIYHSSNNLIDESSKNFKKSGLMLLLSKTSLNIVKPVNVNSFENDFNKYILEASADLDECPLDWWNKYGYMYGRLKKLADTYNCVPACCNNRFLFSIEARTAFEDRRANLTGNCINEILFLNYNK